MTFNHFVTASASGALFQGTLEQGSGIDRAERRDAQRRLDVGDTEQFTGWLARRLRRR